MLGEVEESSKMMFDKVKYQIESVREASNEIMQYESDQKDDAITSMNKEIDDMCTDPIIFVDIENDLKDVERDFSEDPALEAFKAKYEVRISQFPFHFVEFRF